MNKPTVAHIKDNFLPKSETFIYTLISSLSNYQPIVLDRHKYQNKELFPFIAYYSPAEKYGKLAGLLERAALRYLGISPFLTSVIKQQNAKILHAHFGQLGALFVPVSQRHNLPLITSFYDNDISVFVPNPQWSSRFQKLWQHGNKFLALSPYMRDKLISLGCPPQKTVILPLCIDITRFAFTPHPRPQSGEMINLITVGRLVPKKGIDVLLEALAQCPDYVRLTIVGDGPEKESLRQQIDNLQLEQRVHFTGWVDNETVARLMNEADIFVLASRTSPVDGAMEGTPTVLLEAQARGIPVIATRHAGIPDIVADGKSGILVPENNAGALAEAIQQMEQMSPEDWLNMGRAGRQLVAAKHDRHIVAHQLEQIYKECLSN